MTSHRRTSPARRAPKHRDAYAVQMVRPAGDRHALARSGCGSSYARALRLAGVYRAVRASPGAVVLVYAPQGNVRHRWTYDRVDGWRVDEPTDSDLRF
jgi:hypothetical protein